MKKILVVPFIVLIFLGCGKEDEDNNVFLSLDYDGLPYATRNGAQTMGCLIDGDPWIPQRTTVLGNLVYDIDFTVWPPEPNGGGLSIQGHKDHSNEEQLLTFKVAPLQDTGLVTTFTRIHNVFGNFTGDCYYNLDSSYHDNWVHVSRLDYDESIVSGTFNFQIISLDCDTILVSEGRFDLHGN